MASPFGREVFAVGDRAYTWVDVVLAAVGWSDWLALEERVRQGLACAARLDSGDGEVDPDLVGRAADEFRYERDLLTAEDTEAWLVRWALTTDAWMDAVQRAVLRREWADDLADIATAYPVPAAQVTDATWADGVCAGDWSRLAVKLAGRAAVAPDAGGPAPSAGPAGSGEPQPATRVSDAAVATARTLLGLEPDACGTRLAQLGRLEHGFARYQADVVQRTELKAVLSAHGLDWTEIRLAIASFPDEPAAREAALCVREDGEALAAVAKRVHVPLREEDVCLEDASPALRDLVLTARPGEVLGPVTVEGQCLLVHVLAKTLPSLDAPRVRARAEAKIVQQAVDRAVTDRVRWLDPL